MALDRFENESSSQLISFRVYMSASPDWNQGPYEINARLVQVDIGEWLHVLVPCAEMLGELNNTLLEVKIVLGFFFKKSEIDINGWVELTLL
jgi:hypothetical protein